MYHRVPVDVTWPVARSMANALTYKGVQGSLVSIRSAAEQVFVSCLILCLFFLVIFEAPPLLGDFWIGGSDEAVEGLPLISLLWFELVRSVPLDRWS